MTQKEMILSHLKSGYSLTPLEALDCYRIFRLAARIWEMKAAGIDIKTEVKRDRTGKQYAVYTLD